MKKTLFLLLFSLSLFAQNDSISVSKPNLSSISLNKLNIVYKGISNPISINVKNSNAFKIKGESVFKKQDSTYYIQPKSGKETKVFIEIQTSDTTKVVEEHIFRIKDLPYAALLVNGKGCINGDCTIEMPTKELLNAEISLKLIDFLLDYNISVTSFRLYLSNNNGDFLDSFEIKGNKIPKDVYDDIISNEKATFIILHKLTFASDLKLAIEKTPMIKIKKI